MRIVMGLIVIALMGLLVASVYYAYGIWNALEATDMPGWIYVAMAGGVIFSLLVGGGLMGLVFYSNRAGYDDDAAHNDR
jgi:cation transporter-like permease